MKCGLWVLVFLHECCTAASLNVRRRNESTLGTHHVPSSGTASARFDKVARVSQTANPLLSFGLDQSENTTCTGSQCEFDHVTTLLPKLVWFIGCSLDSQALMHTCLAAGAQVMPHNQATDNLFKFCSFNGFTLAFTFIPGATPPPYYDYYHFATTTEEIVRTSLLHVQQTFGKLPDATVVDSSLWDVANWWKKSGSPQIWPVPTAAMFHWCSHTVPTFLNFVQATIPSTRLAFRTPPPVFQSCIAGFEYMCRGPEIIETMYSCLQKNTNTVTHQLYSKFALLDYHAVVLSTHKAMGGQTPLRAWYADTTHPGRDLALWYMQVVLNWVKAT